MRMRRLLALAVAAAAISAVPAGAYHHNQCQGGAPIVFGGSMTPEGHNWFNVCTDVADVYFFGTFGNLAGGDPSGMCGYIVVDTEGPADMYFGLAGDMQGGMPNPIPIAPTNGDWHSSHPPGPGCVPDP